MIHRSIQGLLFLALLLSSAAHADNHTVSGDASELIRNSQRVVGQLVRYAGADPALKTDRTEAKPFWDATRELNEALDKADTGLRLQEIFESLIDRVS